jgi:CubicO group peptidase (beta-lactamase class C family)/pimeloyl-ACP methyl ester carboxylesterase
MRKTLILLSVAAGAVAFTQVPAQAEGPAWGPCPFEGPVECATVEVPMDYRDPAGEQLDIHISLRRSERPDLRRGTLIMNQGGPGTHLVDAASIDSLAPKSVLDAYDIISFDQRGFGTSTPVHCGLALDEQLTFPWPLPGGEPAMRQRAKRIADKCASQELMPYLGTANVARDMDRIRAAVGADKITYVGVSYGTYLGVAYDTLFPQRVDRMLLDSNVDPAAAWRNAFRDSMTNGVEVRFGDFARSLGRPENDVRQEFLDLVRGLDAAPLSTPNGVLTSELLRIGLFAGMYNDRAFPLVDQLMTAVRDRDAATAGEIGDQLGLWFDDDNTASAQLGVFCADGTFPRDPAVYARDAKADARRFPLTGGAGGGIWPCAFWHADPLDPPIAVNPRGRSNILLTNNLRDPATTFGAATSSRRQYGDRARLVGVEQGGHGAYLFSDNACVQQVGNDFLLHGTRPDGLTCPAEHAGLAGAVSHLTTVDHAPGAAAEVRGPDGAVSFRSGRLTATDRVRVFSNTKAFVATVVLRLVAERRVTLDAPVSRYLPGLIRDDITVRQILQHTSGVPDFDSSVFEPGGYQAHRFDHHTPASLVADALTQPYLPAGEFHYSTTNYVVAGMLVEKVTGRPYAREVEDRILRPLRMRNTVLPGDNATIPGRHAHGYAHVDARDQISDSGRRVDVTLLNPSLVWAGGEAVSTVADLNTFFDALLAGRLLPPAQLAEMRKTVPANLVPGSGYGLGLMRVPLSCGGEYWTHGGSGLGFQTRSGATDDGRQVSVVINTAPATADQSASMLTAVDTALCE